MKSSLMNLYICRVLQIGFVVIQKDLRNYCSTWRKSTTTLWFTLLKMVNTTTTLDRNCNLSLWTNINMWATYLSRCIWPLGQYTHIWYTSIWIIDLLSSNAHVDNRFIFWYVVVVVVVHVYEKFCFTHLTWFAGIDEKNDPTLSLDEALKDTHRIKYYYDHLSHLRSAIR